jgi:hypothetical protein
MSAIDKARQNIIYEKWPHKTKVSRGLPIYRNIGLKAQNTAKIISKSLTSLVQDTTDYTSIVVI